jgi:hypothetical protein
MLYALSTTISPMVIRPELRNILEVVGHLSHHDIGTNVADTSVVQNSGRHSSMKVYDCLDELKSRGLIKMLQPIPDTKQERTTRPVAN